MRAREILARKRRLPEAAMIQDKAVWGSKDAGFGFGRTACVAAIAMVTVVLLGKAVWG
jgi:hypothetical protein